MTTKPKIRATQSDVKAVKFILAGRGWIKSQRICGMIPYAKYWDRRKLRAISEASNGEIIGTNKGYRLTLEATKEERQHAANIGPIPKFDLHPGGLSPV